MRTQKNSGSSNGADGGGDDALLRRVRSEDGVVRAELTESVRISEAPALGTRLAGLSREQQGRRVELDLSRTHTLDSGALGVFIEFHKDLAQEDRELVLVQPTHEIMSLFKIMKLDSVLNIERGADADTDMGHGSGADA